MDLQYEVYLYIHYGAAILAVIMLLITIILFFALKIPAVIGDLSGATARKAIENIRNQNESTGEKEHAPSAVNRERGRLTDKISPSGNLLRNPSNKLGGGMRTEKISTQKLSEDANETTVLYSGGNETTVLGGNETTILSGNETTVLSNMGAGETTLLSDMGVNGETGKLTTEASVMPAAPAVSIFEIEYEITFIHSQEVIV